MKPNFLPTLPIDCAVTDYRKWPRPLLSAVFERPQSFSIRSDNFRDSKKVTQITGQTSHSRLKPAFCVIKDDIPAVQPSHRLRLVSDS
ncbi:hypothetical protein AVEN_21697-1, partial [Araneus ventricosus]